MRLLPF